MGSEMCIRDSLYFDQCRAHVFVSWLHPFKEQKLVLQKWGMLYKRSNIERYTDNVIYADRVHNNLGARNCDFLKKKFIYFNNAYFPIS